MRNILRLIITVIIFIVVLFKAINDGFDMIYSLALILLGISLISFSIVIFKRRK